MFTRLNTIRQDASAVPVQDPIFLEKPEDYRQLNVSEEVADKRSQSWRRILNLMTNARIEPELTLPNFFITTVAKLHAFRSATARFIERVRSMTPSLDEVLPGYADVEISALQKDSIPGSAGPYSHIRSAEWPWVALGGVFPEDSPVLDYCITRYRELEKHAFGRNGVVRSLGPHAATLGDVPYRVTLGSYTSLDPTAPSNDPALNAWGIVLGSVLWQEAAELAVRRGVKVDDAEEVADGLDVFSEAKRTLYPDMLFPLGMYFVCFGRTKFTKVRRPNSEGTFSQADISKMWPLMERKIDVPDALVATEVNNGIQDDTRTVIGATNSYNQSLTAATYGVKQSMKRDPAFDTGSFLRTYYQFQKFIEAWGVEDLEWLANDQGAYDNHMTKSFKRAHYRCLQEGFGLSDVDMYFYALADHAPLLAQGYFSDDPLILEVFKTKYGIKSGTIDTSDTGKGEMDIIRLETISNLKKPMAIKLTRAHVEAVDRERFIVQDVTSGKRGPKFYWRTNPRGKWLFVDSSDDILLMWKKGWLNKEEYLAYQREKLGLDSTDEGTLIMLKQLLLIYSERKRRTYTSGGAFGLAYGGMESTPMTTLAGSHWINMFLPEHPTPFKEALYPGLEARLSNLEHSPLKESFIEFARPLTSGVLEDWAYDLPTLRRYIGSAAFKRRLAAQIQSSKEGQSNSVLKAMIRSATGGEMNQMGAAAIPEINRMEEDGISRMDELDLSWAQPILKQGFGNFDLKTRSLSEELRGYNFKFRGDTDATLPTVELSTKVAARTRAKVARLAFKRLTGY